MANPFNEYTLGVVYKPKTAITLKDGPIVKTKNGYTFYNGAVLDVDEKGQPIKTKYIGGTTREARDTYWKQSPIIRHAVDSIANEYNIPYKLLRHRLDKEGFTDGNINYINENRDRGVSTYEELNRETYGEGFKYYGLDYVNELIEKGKVHPIRERYYTVEDTNEKGQITNGADGVTTKDNIGLMAATLKYYYDIAKRKYPNSTNAELSAIASAMYNRGEAGAAKLSKDELLNKYSLKGNY